MASIMTSLLLKALFLCITVCSAQDMCTRGPLKSDDCKWYECMEIRFPCQNTGYDYVMNYGKSFCEKFDTIYPVSSQKLKDFIDTGRVCLQQAIWDYGNQSPYRDSTSCEPLEKLAFESHSDCYFTAGFCSLDFVDKLRVIDLIKGSLFTIKNGRGIETIKAGLAVLSRCVFG